MGLSYNSTSQKEEFNGTLSTNFDTSTIDPVFKSLTLIGVNIHMPFFTRIPLGMF